MRLSKAVGSQSADPERDAMREVGGDEGQLYGDHASRNKDDRRDLAPYFKLRRDGEHVDRVKSDRLGRDLYDLVDMLRDLTLHGVCLKLLTGHGAQICRQHCGNQ